jgi:hypothetical protein
LCVEMRRLRHLVRNIFKRIMFHYRAIFR